MIWCAIWKGGRSNIYFMKGKIDADLYIDLMNEFIECDLKPAFPDFEATFMQDGAPCHTANKTRMFLASTGLHVLEWWPANSPDLNPIENGWSMMEEWIDRNRPDARKNMNEFKEAIVDVWWTLDQEVILTG